jgi:Xaa-Pro aminopeptidase
VDQLPPYQADFTADELRTRRTLIAQAIGEPAVALVPGLGELASMGMFRQSNEFYYLTGLEVPRAYLTVEGGSGRSVLFVTHRDLERERSDGPGWSAEHADLLRELTGVDEVRPVEKLSTDFAVRSYRPPRPHVFVPMSPAEGAAQSRIEMTAASARAMADPWDGGRSREQNLVSELRDRFPQLPLFDLSPTLDRMRLVKSPKE